MPGVITLANIAIGYDAKQLKAGIDLSRKDIAQLQKNLEATLTPMENMRNETLALEKALEKGAISSERFAKAQEVISKKFGVETDSARQKRHQDYLAQLKKNTLEMEMKDREKARDKDYAAQQKKEADNQAYLQQLKKNSFEMERKQRETNREYLDRLRKNSLEMEMAERDRKWTESERTRQQFQREGIRLTESARTAAQRYDATIKVLTEHLKAGSISQATFNHHQKEAQRIRDQSPSRGGGIMGMGIGSFTVGGVAASAGWRIFNLITEAAEQLTIGSIKLAAEIESTSVAFEVLTGSSAEALSMLTKMRDLDRESPLNFRSIQRAGKTLLGYGVQAKQIMPSLEALSKISMGNAERFELLSLAFAQVAARGKIAGDEVRQMVNQGFNPLMAIAEKMVREQGGQVQDYMDKLRKYMEEGVLSFELMQVAMQETTTGTGKFAKMNERMVETVSGQWNKLVSNWQVTQQKMGEAVSPVTMFFLKNINEILESKDNPVVKLDNLLNLNPFALGGTVGIANRLAFGDTAAAAEQARKKEKERKEEEEKKKNKTAQELIDEKREFERKEAEKKKLEEEQQRVKDKLQSEVDKLDEKVAGEARRLGMSPRQAALDERFFDLMKEVNSVFGANSVEVKKLNGLMQQSGKQFDKELKMKEQEIQSEAKKKQAERQDRFNKWFMESVNPDNLTGAKTELLQKDSVEAYKFMIQRDDAIEKRKQEIEMQKKKLQEENNEILKKMQEDLKDAPRLVKI